MSLLLLLTKDLHTIIFSAFDIVVARVMSLSNVRMGQISDSGVGYFTLNTIITFFIG